MQGIRVGSQAPVAGSIGDFARPRFLGNSVNEPAAHSLADDSRNKAGEARSRGRGGEAGERGAADSQARSLPESTARTFFAASCHDRK